MLEVSRSQADVTNDTAEARAEVCRSWSSIKHYPNAGPCLQEEARRAAAAALERVHQHMPTEAHTTVRAIRRIFGTLNNPTQDTNRWLGDLTAG